MFYVYVLYVYALYALFGGGIRGGVLYDAHERMLFILFWPEVARSWQRAMSPRLIVQGTVI